MAKAPLVNGKSARQLAVIIEHCTNRDACNTCPYDKKLERGRSCIDFLLADAALAIRRQEKRYEKQRERYRLDKEKMTMEIMARPLWVVYFTDTEFKEVRMLGVFDDEPKAKAFLREKEQDVVKAQIKDIRLGIQRTTDRLGK